MLKRRSRFDLNSLCRRLFTLLGTQLKTLLCCSLISLKISTVAECEMLSGSLSAARLKSGLDTFKYYRVSSFQNFTFTITGQFNILAYLYFSKIFNFGDRPDLDDLAFTFYPQRYAEMIIPLGEYRLSTFVLPNNTYLTSFWAFHIQVFWLK